VDETLRVRRSRALLPLFGAATAAKSAIWAVTDLLLGAFLHRFTDLSGATIAILLCMLLLIGAAADLLIGFLLSRPKMTGTAIAAVQFAGAVATGLLLLGQFIIPLDRPIWLLTAAVSFRLAYAAFDVPLTTLTSLLPRDALERERYVRVRMVGGAITRLLVTGLNAYAAAWAADRLASIGMALLGLVVITVTVCSGALLLSVVKLGVGTAHAEVPREDSAREHVSIPSLRSLLVAFLIATAMVPTLSRLLVFVGSDLTNANGPLLLCSFSFGSVVGPFALAPMRRWLGRLPPMTVVAGLVLCSSLMLGIAIGAAGLAAMVALALLHGIALGMVGTLLWIRAASLAANATGGADRRDSVVFGSVTACTQVSIAIGTLALAPFIDGVARIDDVTLMAAAAVSSLGAVILMRGGSVEEDALQGHGRSADRSGVSFDFGGDHGGKRKRLLVTRRRLRQP
jgi:Na+/melibiose symporter-like transporter